MHNLNTSSQNNTAPTSTVLIPRMLPLKDVVYFTALSSTTIYDMLDKKSNRYDPSFPIQVKLSKRRVAWVESEIAQWLGNRMAIRFN